MMFRPTVAKAMLTTVSLTFLTSNAHAAFVGPSATSSIVRWRPPIVSSSDTSSRNSLGQWSSVSSNFISECSGGEDVDPSDLPMTTRRAALTNVARSLLFSVGLPIFCNPSSAVGAEDVMNEGQPSLYLAQPMRPPGSPSGSKPYAPTEFLLPAARVKVYIDTATEVADELAKLQAKKSTETTSAAETETKITNAFALLGQLLTAPPSFVRATDPKRKTDDSGKFLSSLDVAKQKQKEREVNKIEVGIAPRALEVFELSGERRQWNRLQKQERAREDASEVRRAFNIYTTNLVFDEEKYKFTGNKEEKSKLIRDDKLPTAKTVIRSDLDLRDLFRNQVQTGLEDVWAEYEFQAKQGRMNFDGGELLLLLRDAQVACDKWFSFIDEGEARVSLEAVLQEPNMPIATN